MKEKIKLDKELRVMRARVLKVKRLKALVGKKKAAAIVKKHLKFRAKVAKLEAAHKKAIAKLIVGKNLEND